MQGVYVICNFPPVGADLCPKGWYIRWEALDLGEGVGTGTLPRVGSLKGTSLVLVEWFSSLTDMWRLIR